MSNLTEDDAPALNPDLDRIALANAFSRSGRLHIPNVLTDASAKHVYHALEQQTPWGLTFNDGKKEHKFASVSAEDHQQMALAAWDRAHSGFQYFYHHYHLLEDQRLHPSPDQYLGKLIKFMVAPHFLEFIREVTGVQSIVWLSATATLFKPLDFLTAHDDGHPNSSRVIAYVLNMTPEWRPDWGGALQFYDSKDHIEEGYLPSFNALNLFRIPKLHSVSQVSAFGGMRYSISGWFERRKPTIKADQK